MMRLLLSRYPAPYPGMSLGQRLSILLLTALALVAVGPGEGRADAPTVDREAQRSAYRAARAAISRGAPGALAAARVTLGAYPLYPYLVHADLLRRLDRADENEIRAFLASWAELPAATRLRERWLRLLAEDRAWERFLAFDDPALRAVELRCHRLAAALATGADAPYDSTTSDLWLHGQSRPKACDPVFAHWRRAGALTPAQVLERTRLAVLAGETSMAGWLARQLPPAEATVAARWRAAGARPERELARIADWPPAAQRAEFVSPLLENLARRDIGSAYRVWHAVRPVLPPERAGALERHLAILRATDYGPDAVARLAALPREYVTPQVRAWRVRVAIARGAWRTVRDQIEAMAPEQRDEARWQYWWARAAEALGDTGPATARYAVLADRTNYHGFLAADRLAVPYVLCADTTPAPTDRLLGRPGIERAIELHAVGQSTEARREWRAAVADLAPEERLAAALLAAAQGWHHQAILDLAGLNRLDRYEERFPVPWSGAVATGAQRQALPPSLVYAVMRSESALAPDARSGAGARGLMQLLPATAQGLARQAGVRFSSRGRLYDPELNILLGSAYLRKLVDDIGHPLEVLAAYNAGPRPVARWQASGRLPVEADRWIETIPYRETRDYVPRVLTFQAIYEWQLHGRMTRLARMMRPLDESTAWPRQWGPGSVTPLCPADRAVAAGGRRLGS